MRQYFSRAQSEISLALDTLSHGKNLSQEDMVAGQIADASSDADVRDCTILQFDHLYLGAAPLIPDPLSPVINVTLSQPHGWTRCMLFRCILRRFHSLAQDLSNTAIMQDLKAHKALQCVTQSTS